MTTTQAQQKIGALRAEMKTVLWERSHVVDGMLTALLAGEHTFLLGPPGTAKSLVTNLMCKAIDGACYFEWLVTKFTTPEELFGPMSLKALEEDRFRRNTTDMLPEAHVAFLDEIFKANSAILNSTLRLINEREYHNDGRAIPCPLESMVGASNELPESQDLEALFDRFLARYWVGPIADRGNLKSMLTAPEPTLKNRIDFATLQQAQQDARAIPMSDTMLEILLDTKAATEREGVKASDRRWRKVIKGLSCYAYLCGDTEVTEDNFDILPDFLWRDPSERPALVQTIGKIANPNAAKASEIIDAARELYTSLPNGDARRAEFLASAAEANAQYEGMGTELAELIAANPGKDRKLREALDIVNTHHKKTQKAAARAAGIRL